MAVSGQRLGPAPAAAAAAARRSRVMREGAAPQTSRPLTACGCAPVARKLAPSAFKRAAARRGQAARLARLAALVPSVRVDRADALCSVG
eukprot:5801177-Pyramimonas_sp.AAC.1